MNAVVLPGQILPLHFTDQPTIEFLSESNRRRSYFGLLTLEKEREQIDAMDMSLIPCHNVGTLFKVYYFQITYNNTLFEFLLSDTKFRPRK